MRCSPLVDCFVACVDRVPQAATSWAMACRTALLTAIITIVLADADIVALPSDGAVQVPAPSNATADGLTPADGGVVDPTASPVATPSQTPTPTPTPTLTPTPTPTPTPSPSLVQNGWPAAPNSTVPLELLINAMVRDANDSVTTDLCFVSGITCAVANDSSNITVVYVCCVFVVVPSLAEWLDGTGAHTSWCHAWVSETLLVTAWALLATACKRG